MADDGDRVPPPGPIVGPRAPPPPVQQLSVPTLQRAAEFLQENSKIHFFRSHYLKYRRYAPLETQEIFNQLVELYANLFKSQYSRFRRIYDNLMTAATGVSGWTALARVYISIWLYDLYVSNRLAVQKLSVLAFNEHFRHELVPFTSEYDELLSLLNATIRPTHLIGISEDALYIPLLHAAPAWTTTNPFAITNFNPDMDVFYAIQELMRQEGNWKLTPLSSNALGRPAWLFDWHDDSKVCAWFPQEGNYNEQDATLAYIIGVACTPKLGPRDVDDWVLYPSGVVPQNPTSKTYQRTTERLFHGSYEVRTILVDEYHTHDVQIPESELSEDVRKSKKRKQLTIADKSTPATTPDPSATSSGTMDYSTPAPRYKITDWIYYQQIFHGLDQHTRSAAHRMLSFK